MREPVENGCTAGFNCFLKGFTDGVEIIQQME
jgi:hypothetical protein